MSHGVARINRLLKIIRLFCKRALQKRRYSGKVTYNLIDPTDCIQQVARRDSVYICTYIYTYIHTYIYIYTSSIDHLVMREFVSRPPRYHLAIKGVREQFVRRDSGTSSIDHLVMREFVSGPPRYHLDPPAFITVTEKSLQAATLPEYIHIISMYISYIYIYIYIYRHIIYINTYICTWKISKAARRDTETTEQLTAHVMCVCVCGCNQSFCRFPRETTLETTEINRSICRFLVFFLSFPRSFPKETTNFPHIRHSNDKETTNFPSPWKQQGNDRTIDYTHMILLLFNESHISDTVTRAW